MFMQAPQMTGYLVTGNVPELNGNASPTKQPTSNVFASRDGYVQVIAMKETQVEALFAELGIPERYANLTNPLCAWRDGTSCMSMIAPLIAAKTTEHWLQRTGRHRRAGVSDTRFCDRCRGAPVGASRGVC